MGSKVESSLCSPLLRGDFARIISTMKPSRLLSLTAVNDLAELFRGGSTQLTVVFRSLHESCSRHYGLVWMRHRTLTAHEIPETLAALGCMSQVQTLFGFSPLRCCMSRWAHVGDHPPCHGVVNVYWGSSGRARLPTGRPCYKTQAFLASHFPMRRFQGP